MAALSTISGRHWLKAGLLAAWRAENILKMVSYSSMSSCSGSRARTSATSSDTPGLDTSAVTARARAPARLSSTEGHDSVWQRDV